MVKEKQEKQDIQDAESLSDAPASQKDSIRSFISTLASFSGDLSSLTCPSFLLSPMSLLEYSQYWGDHPDMLADIPNGISPEERLLRCTRWFIATLYSSYQAKSNTTGMEKKPLNPILGEQFFAQWSNENHGDTTLIAEQVSHHPPIFGFHIENKKANVILQGHCGQKTKFSVPAGIDVIQNGYAMLTLPHFNEHYLITLPTLQVRGLITGRPYVDTAGSTHIISTTGLHTVVDYSSKGYFSGHRNSFKATLKYITDNKKDKDNHIYIAKGTWSGSSTYSTDKKAEPIPFYDATTTPPHAPEVKPLEEMNPIESRKLWAEVAAALNSKDYSTASKEKSKIEEAQRALAKDRKGKSEDQASALKLFDLVTLDADEYGKVFSTLKEQLVSIAGSKAIHEDDKKPHWRLRQ